MSVVLLGVTLICGFTSCELNDPYKDNTNYYDAGKVKDTKAKDTYDGKWYPPDTKKYQYKDTNKGFSLKKDTKSYDPPVGTSGCKDGSPYSLHYPIKMQVAGFKPIPQICAYWCWAASISMVFSGLSGYSENKPSPCYLASYKSGGYNCCFQAACQSSICNQTAQEVQISYMLKQLGIHTKYSFTSVNEFTLAQEIYNGRPVILGLKSNIAGHVVVVYAISRTKQGEFLYDVVDPINGVFTNLSYTKLKYGYAQGSMVWRSTWYQLYRKYYGCKK